MEQPHETTWVRLGYKIPREPAGDQAMEATTGARPGQVDPWRSASGMGRGAPPRLPGGVWRHSR